MSFDGFYISIHSLRMEGDISIKNMTANYPYFNPLPPYGGRHPRMRLRRMPETFQSTPSVWRETSRRRTFPDSQQRISIHSLRMEGDFVLFEVHHITCYFNPLPPYGGRRLIRYPFSRIHAFQSTPSVWRETRSRLSAISQPIFQSTPSVWRETVQKCLSCFQ